MSHKIFDRLTDVVGMPGANAASKATLTIPAGDDPGAGICEALRFLVKKGAAPATLNEIRAGLREFELMFGSEPVQAFKASELYMEQEFNGETPVDGILDIPFAEQWRALVADEAVLAPELRRYPKVQLKFDVVNGATPFEFVFQSEIRSDAQKVTPDGRPVGGMIGKTVQISDVSGGTPTVKIDPLNGPLQRLFIQYPSTANLSRVVLMQGERTLYDIEETATIKGLTAQLRPYKMKVPANFTDFAGTWKTWPLVFDNNQRLTDALENPAGLKLKLYIDTPATLRILRETRFARG